LSNWKVKCNFFIMFFNWGCIVTFTKILTIYHSWIHALHHSPLSPSSTPEIVSHFSAFIHQCIKFLLHSASFTLSLCPALFPLVLTARWELFSVFEKKALFCLFKIALQGVSLWYFHENMYYSLNWFISSIFLLSTLIPFLWWWNFFLENSACYYFLWC
jgi:hypothetical protein